MEPLDICLSLPSLDQWFSNLSGVENNLEQLLKCRSYNLEGPWSIWLNSYSRCFWAGGRHFEKWYFVLDKHSPYLVALSVWLGGRYNVSHGFLSFTPYLIQEENHHITQSPSSSFVLKILDFKSKMKFFLWDTFFVGYLLCVEATWRNWSIGTFGIEVGTASVGHHILIILQEVGGRWGCLLVQSNWMLRKAGICVCRSWDYLRLGNFSESGSLCGERW